MALPRVLSWLTGGGNNAPQIAPPGSVPEVKQNRSDITAYLLANAYKPQGDPKSVGEGVFDALNMGLEGYFAKRLSGEQESEKQAKAQTMADLLVNPTQPKSGQWSPGKMWAPDNQTANPQNAQLTNLLAQGLIDPSALQPAVMAKLGFGPGGDPFTMGPGEVRFDAAGNEIASVPSIPTSSSLKPIIETLFDPATGREIKAQYDPATDTWNQIGGVKSDLVSPERLNQLVEINKAGASSITVGGESLSPGQKKIDEAFADEWIQWNATGGYADVDKQLSQLEEALTIIESNPGITGPAIGLVPDYLQPFFNEQGVIAKNKVEEVVQRNLRIILGAQFTEREGERLIARAYNPQLPPEENARRVRALINQIRAMADSKQAAVDYFDANGTMRGFKGLRPSTTDLDSLGFGDVDPTIDELLKKYGQ